MYVVATFLFVVVLVFAFLDERLSATMKLYILVGMALVMVSMSTFKDIRTTADAKYYVNYFENNDDPLIEIMTEPTYIYLSRLLIAVGAGIECLFFIYAVVTIPLKLRAISKLTPFLFTALLVYIPVYYLLHDVVQIRAGAAAAFLLVSMYLLGEKKYIWAVIAFVVGVLFHYSSFVFLPVLIWGNRRLNVPIRFFLAMLVPIGFLMYEKGLDLLSFLPSSLTSGKIDFYKESAEAGNNWTEFVIPYKNLYLLSKCLLLFLCLVFYETIYKYNKYINSCLVMLAASIFVNLSMITIPVIAGRVGDMYGITDAVTFSFCLYFIKPGWVVKCVIAVLGMYMMVYKYLYGGLVV